MKILKKSVLGTIKNDDIPKLSSSSLKENFKRLSLQEKKTSPTIQSHKKLSVSPPSNKKKEKLKYNKILHTSPNTSIQIQKPTRRKLQQSLSTDFLPIIPKNEIITELDHFAKGSFSSVYAGRLIKTNKKIVLKVFDQTPDIQTGKNLYSNSYNSHENFLHEWKILGDIPKFENIVEFCGAIEFKPHIMALVFEYCNAGTLVHFLQTNAFKLIKLDYVEILHGISLGLNCIHSFDPPLIHYDITSNNILISIQNTKIIPKICDFGSTRYLNEEKKFLHQITTEPYTPPEYWEKTEPHSTYFDIFSFGIIISEIITVFATGKYYFPYKYQKSQIYNDEPQRFQIINMIKKGIKPIIPENADNTFLKIMNSCLNIDIQSRSSAKDLCLLFENVKKDLLSQKNEIVLTIK